MKKLLEPNNPDRKAAESQFRLFCDKRRTVMARAFLEWLKELDDRRKSVNLDNVRPDVPELVEDKALDPRDAIRKRVRKGEVTDKATLEDFLIRVVEGIERGTGHRLKRVPLRKQNQGADKFAVVVRYEEAGKRSEQRILVLEVDGTGMTIRLIDERLRPAFEDLLTLLGQAGNKEAWIGSDEAKRVTDDIAEKFALLVNTTESHLHTTEHDFGA